MLYRGQDKQISDLDLTIYNDLVNELIENSNWKKVAAYVVQKNGFPRRPWIDDLERIGNSPNSKVPPAGLLLKQLTFQKCDVGILCDILRNCELFDALYIIIGQEKLKIIQQPNTSQNGRSYEAEISDHFSIKCIAKGVPAPKYQWCYGNCELPGQTSSTLEFCVESPDQAGEYRCMVSQYNRDGKLIYCENSNFALLEIKPTPVEILNHTPSCRVKIGETLILTCKAKGHPSPQYQWFKGKTLLENQTSNTLRIKKFRPKHSGEYRCRVSNVRDTKETEEIGVKVDRPRETAVAKIALLIANSNYIHQEILPLAVPDAITLQKELKDLGFTVMMYENLTLNDMKSAIKLYCASLQGGAYGLFYFAGHGCMIDDYQMMPIDVPAKFDQQHTVSQKYFLDAIETEKLKLQVGIFDMCLKGYKKALDPKFQEEPLKTLVSKSYDGLLLAYPTCSYNKSYETLGAKNGRYMTYLSKHIGRNQPIIDIFSEVSNAIGDASTDKTRDQKPMIICRLSKPYQLNDRIDTPMEYREGLKARYLDLVRRISYPKDAIEQTFSHCNVSFRVKIQSLRPPCLNVMKLTVIGLDDWEVNFYNSPKDRVELYLMDKTCVLFNLQGTNKETLTIQIRRNETHHAIAFPYTKYIPAILKDETWRIPNKSI